MQLDNIDRLNINIQIGRDAFGEISRDWDALAEPPILIVLSEAVQNFEQQIGWYGEFVRASDLDFLNNKYVTGFQFTVDGIRFFGSTDSLEKAEQQLNNSQLRYLGNGKSFIDV